MEVTTVTTERPNALLAGVRSVLELADEGPVAVAFVKFAGVNTV